MSAAGASPLHVYLVAGETSGDELGARLMLALRAAAPVPPRFSGVGGGAMAEQGLLSLFPLEDIAVMGFLPVIARLPTLLARIRRTAEAVIAANPDILVIIDSPDFTHRVAKRVRARLPGLPIVDYVSPSVWAWRPGRAKKMRGYVDHVLALLPFEPAAHQRLGGPECAYVGHPLIERFDELRPSPAEALARESGAPSILIMPGSRRSEITRLLDVFGQTAAEISRALPRAQFVLPAVAHLESEIRAGVSGWAVAPTIILGEAAKFAAFRGARAALAASGTVTLELALSGVPTVLAYRTSRIEEAIMRALLHVRWAGLPNLILDRQAIPEFIQRDCVPGKLSAALLGLAQDGPERAGQLAAFAEIDRLMSLPTGESPGSRAAGIVLGLAGKRQPDPISGC